MSGFEQQSEELTEQKRKKPKWKELLVYSSFLLATAQAMAVPSERGRGAEKEEKPKTEQAYTPAEVAENTYIVTAENPESQAHSFELKSFFAPNEADISPENEEKIIKQVHAHLESVFSDEDQVRAIIASEKVIRVSCDATPAGAEHQFKNAVLGGKRADEGKKIVELAFETFDYSRFPYLSDADITQFKTIDFSISIPEYPEAERGVTPYTAITNPETGEPFTEEEFQQLDREEKEAVMQQARYVTVFFEMKPELLDSIAETEDMYKGFVHEVLSQYESSMVAFDNSTSMKDSRRLFARSVSEYADENVFPKDFSFAPFTTRLGEVHQVDSPEKLVKVAEQIGVDGVPDERIVTTALQAIAHFEKKKEDGVGTKVLVLATDEKMQDLSLRSLRELNERAEEENVEVLFWLLSDDHQRTRSLTLAEVNTLFESHFATRENLKKKHDALTRLYSDAIDQGKGVAAAQIKKDIDAIENQAITIGVNPREKVNILLPFPPKS